LFLSSEKKDKVWKRVKKKNSPLKSSSAKRKKSKRKNEKNIALQLNIIFPCLFGENI
jgi:hypothetical protein